MELQKQCTIEAPAKLNLTLDVCGVRPDGYHELKSLMQSVTLYDTVTVSIGSLDGNKITVSCDKTEIPVDERNVAWKAAEAFYASAGIPLPEVHIDLVKRIPSQAGMGGGSADAAAVLEALNRLYDGIFRPSQLLNIAAGIGADVPFCLFRKTALAGGIGEKLEAVENKCDFHYLIVKPTEGLSTPAVFKAFDRLDHPVHPDTCAARTALENGDFDAFFAAAGNSLEAAACSLCKPLGKILEYLGTTGALYAAMTGSGSALFAIYADETERWNAAYKVLRRYPRASVFVAENISE